MNIIQEVLDTSYANLITQKHIDLYKELIKSEVTLPLPIPNSKQISEFAKIAGPEAFPKDYNKCVYGC